MTAAVERRKKPQMNKFFLLLRVSFLELNRAVAAVDVRAWCDDLVIVIDSSRHHLNETPFLEIRREAARVLTAESASEVEA